MKMLQSERLTLHLVQVDQEQRNMLKMVVKGLGVKVKVEHEEEQVDEEEVLMDLKGLLHLQEDPTLLLMELKQVLEDLMVLTLGMELLVQLGLKANLLSVAIAGEEMHEDLNWII